MVIYTMEYDSVLKKEWNLATCNNMQGPTGYCAEWNKTEDKCHMILLLRGI